MEIDQNILTGFLTGSLATLIIKGGIDYIIKWFDYKRELKKGYYFKKLDSAEESIRHLTKAYNSIVMVVIAIENLIEVKMDGELFDQIWVVYFDQLAKAEEGLINTSSTLYFQFTDNQKWNESNQRDLFEAYSKIKVLKDQIDYYNNEISKSETEEERVMHFNQVESLSMSLIDEMKKLASMLRRNSEAIWHTIEQIKSDLKK